MTAQELIASVLSHKTETMSPKRLVEERYKLARIALKSMEQSDHYRREINNYRPAIFREAMQSADELELDHIARGEP